LGKGKIDVGERNGGAIAVVSEGLSEEEAFKKLSE
jgi:hypothetical protein